MQWQANGENTTCSRNISSSQRAEIGLNALACDGKAQAETGFVMTVLIEGLEHPGSASGRQPSTVVFDINQDMVVERMSFQGDSGVRVRELERVLQEIL
ncbi:hypothetical protein D9M69_569570 [compost metagenome]